MWEHMTRIEIPVSWRPHFGSMKPLVTKTRPQSCSMKTLVTKTSLHMYMNENPEW
jgi:hypothetical protein